MDAGRELEFCRGLARRHLLSSPAASAPVVYRQYRFSPRAPRRSADPKLQARGMPQRRCRFSVGVNAYAAYGVSRLGLRVVGQRSGAIGAVSVRRLPLVDICGASTSNPGIDAWPDVRPFAASGRFVRLTDWLGREVAGRLTRWPKSHIAATL